MKIGYIIGSFPSLSETFVSREVTALIDAGIEIEIYAFERPKQQDIRLLSAGATKLLERTQYISRTEAAAALMDPKVLRALPANRAFSRSATARTHSLLRLGRAAAVAARATKDRITALHAHWPYASQIAHLASDVTRLPYSISVHAHEVAHDNGHFPIVFGQLSFAAFCNRGAMEHLFELLKSPSQEHAHLVYHGVDLAAFEPLPWPHDAQPLEIVSAGRLTRTKGFDRLIRACAVARRRNLDIRLTILGAGAMQKSLQQLAEELGFSDRLSLPGWVSHGEVRRHMERAHVFALLADTGFHDGLPNVVLEAMACGRPAILSPLPAASEAVTNGIEGFVLQSADDVEGFVEALQLGIQQPELLRKMGEAARMRVQCEHDARVQIDRMAGLFRRYAA